MNLYVVRHGETDMGKNHIIANETEPLNANGIRQAQNLHNELEKLRIDSWLVWSFDCKKEWEEKRDGNIELHNNSG